jgi:hypothetical protein
MGSVLHREIPIFAGFRHFFAGHQPHGKVLLSLIESEEKLEQALEFIDKLMNVEGKPGGAISIVIPVAQVRGARIRYKHNEP